MAVVCSVLCLVFVAVGASYGRGGKKSAFEKWTQQYPHGLSTKTGSLAGADSASASTGRAGALPRESLSTKDMGDVYRNSRATPAFVPYIPDSPLSRPSLKPASTRLSIAQQGHGQSPGPVLTRGQQSHRGSSLPMPVNGPTSMAHPASGHFSPPAPGAFGRMPQNQSGARGSVQFGL